MAAKPVLVENPPELRFLLTGTARSGTTLVQRLACELPGVWVPQETHFWTLAEQLSEDFEWPLTGDDRQAAAAAALAELADGRLPAAPRSLARQMMSRHRRIGLWTLFESLVAAMSPPDRLVLGEKTPNHLHWWEAIATAVPSVKLVTVVRDPVAVLRSHRGVPWGEHDAHALAERWIAHQRIALDAVRVFGPSRALILRYEDVVAEPAAAQQKLAGLLGVEAATAPIRRKVLAEFPLFTDEETWKRRALEKVKARRSRRDPPISASDRLIIEAACAGLMHDLGYGAPTVGGAEPAQGESLAKVQAFRRWQGSVAARNQMPIY